MDNNDLIPLEWAAEHLSVFNFPDASPPGKVLEWLQQLYGNKGGPFPPLYALRRLFSIENRPRVEYWVRAGMLKVYPSPNSDDTQEAASRWVRCRDLEELLPIELPWEKDDLGDGESAEDRSALDDEYDLGEVEYPAMTLGDEWRQVEEREQLLREQCAHGNTEPKSLKAWFLRDNWTTQEGLLLLLGLIPGSCVELPSTELDGPRIASARLLDGSLVSFDDWRLANVADDMARNHGTPIPLDEYLTSRQLLDLSYRLQHMREIWDSGDHAPRNPPSYFIAWAGRKNFPPPWLGWARANGLFGHEDEATGVGVEMPYEPDRSNPFEGMAATVSLPEFMQRVRNLFQWGTHEQETRMRLLDALPLVTARDAGRDIWVSRYATVPTPKRAREIDPASIAPYIDHDAPVIGSYTDCFAPERVWLSREWVLAWLEKAALTAKDEKEESLFDPQSEAIRVEPPPVKGVQAQHLAIVIKIIQDLGYDPDNLPAGNLGHRGVRNAVKQKLMEQPWFTESKFKKAWEALKKRDKR